MTLRQLKKATNNNERLLGRGGFGPVYYGRLQDGQEVAVKVLSATSNQGKQEFFNEVPSYVVLAELAGCHLKCFICVQTDGSTCHTPCLVTLPVLDPID